MHTANRSFGRYAYTFLLFAIGVTLLGHGVAATVMSREVPTVLTIGLPFVGAMLAYLSILQHFPSGSWLTGDGVVVVLALGTTAFVNASVPAFYEFVGILDGRTLGIPGGYWNVFVAGVAGFTALGVYELLTRRVDGRYAFWKLSSAAVVSIVAGGSLLWLSKEPFPVVDVVTGLPPITGAALMSVLFDYAELREETDVTQ